MDTTTPRFKPNFLQKIANATAAFSGIPFAAVFLTLPFVLSKPNSDQLFDNLALILMGVTALAIPTWGIIWHVKDIRSRRSSTPFSNEKYWYFGQTLARWLLATILIFYAVSKLTGVQLTASNLWYGTELGRMNGFTLAWSFFGHSKLYSLFIAMGQIAGSVALLFRRTTRLGIVILLPIIVNILVIDFTFDGLEDARSIISVLFFIVIFLLFCEFKAFKAFFWDHAAIKGECLTSPILTGVKKKSLLKALAFLLVMAYALGINYGIVTQIDHSPVDGVWYSRSERQYNDTLHQFTVLDNNLEFFAEGKGCNIKELGKSAFYQLHTTSTGIEMITPISRAGSIKSKDIKGKYLMITRDSLEIRGRRGGDSIVWTFKRKAH